jgi:hypothetical protein
MKVFQFHAYSLLFHVPFIRGIFIECVFCSYALFALSNVIGKEFTASISIRFILIHVYSSINRGLQRVVCDHARFC